jgi:hypothetical protein
MPLYANKYNVSLLTEPEIICLYIEIELGHGAGTTLYPCAEIKLFR